MSIYIAHHRRKTSNVLNTLVLSEQECFQRTSEKLVTTCRITEVSRQRIPSPATAKDWRPSELRLCIPPPRHRTSTESDLGYGFLDVCRIASKMFWIQCQSFHQVSWTLASGRMRSANKSPKIPYSAIVKEVAKWSRIHIQDLNITKKNQTKWSHTKESHPYHLYMYTWYALL